MAIPPQLMEVEFPMAPQPDIVRSTQKDEFYKRQLYDQCFELVQHYLGPRAAMKIQEEVKLVSQLCYYGMTTLSSKQTLGEEYCDILQVHGELKIPAEFSRRFSLLFFQLIVPYLSIKLYAHIEHFLRPRMQNLTDQENPKEETRQKLATWIPRIKSMIESIHRVHTAIFYFYGLYYNIPKRLVNITYIFNRKLDEERPSYSILGVLISIQLLVSGILWLQDNWNSRRTVNSSASIEAMTSPEADSELTRTTGKCSLCLGPRKNTTATSCGHLFCWSCITEWCNSKPECPLDRTPLRKADLLPVYHYGS